MKKIVASDPETRSVDVRSENLERLKTLFPEAVTEGKVNLDVLRQLLGDAVDKRDEKYGLNWHGKYQARQLALTPSTGTLRPCPEDSVDWDTTHNLMIEGDNLEVLKLLQKSYAGRVKLIYIDPPYNTGSDFVYADDYRDNIRNYLEVTGQCDGAGQKRSSNAESSGRYHTNWLNMVYPRLKLARDLLRSDGVVCISIDEVELANLIELCNEIFGEQNKLAELVWKSKSGGANDSQHFAIDHEYVVAYAKSTPDLYLNRDPDATVTTQYNHRDERGEYALDRLDKQSIRYSPAFDYEIEGPDGVIHKPAHRDPLRPNATWRWSKAKVAAQYEDLVFSGGHIYTKNYKSTGSIPRSLLTDNRFGRTRTGKTECRDLMGAEVFDNPKPTKLIRHLLTIASGSDDIVLDFFAGSGSTGRAVFEQNLADGNHRRFVIVQLPMPLDLTLEAQKDSAGFCEDCGKSCNLVEITKERLRRAARQIGERQPDYHGDLGFRVFKLATSSIRAWDPRPDDIETALISGLDHIEPGRTEHDILYELLLKLGLDLCVPIESRTVASKSVHSVGAGALIACLDETVLHDDVEPLAAGIADWHGALAPAGVSTVVFRDSAFVDDVAKTNLAEILKQRGLANIRSL